MTGGTALPTWLAYAAGNVLADQTCDGSYQWQCGHDLGSHSVRIITVTSMIALTDVINQVFARHVSGNFTVVPPALLFPKVALEGGSAVLTQVLNAVTRPYLILVLGVRCEEECIELESWDLERS